MRPVLRLAFVMILTLMALVAESTAATALLQEVTTADTATEKMIDYEIITMPEVPGVRITLDGVTRTTGTDGTVTFSVPKPARDELATIKDRVVILDTEIEVGGEVRATFSKLVGDTPPLIAGYNLSYPVEFAFTDVSGRIVPSERIDVLRVKSSIGNVETIQPNGTTWLLGERLAGGLEVKEVFWSIQDVEVDGTSVVNRAQTKFFPMSDRIVNAPLLFFDSHFNIVDAFFGFSAGEALLVEAPNGSVERIELVDGRASLIQVPRGEYHVNVLGGGLAIERPVAISRTQDVTLKLYTWLDVFVFLLIFGMFVIVPPLVGLRLARRRRLIGSGGSASTQEPQSQSVPAVADRDPDDKTVLLRSRATESVGVRMEPEALT